jgi:hypothetical protein
MTIMTNANTNIEFQTRSEKHGLATFASLQAALDYAEKENSVWKIFFSLPSGERVRLVSSNFTKVHKWVYEDIPTEKGGD